MLPSKTSKLEEDIEGIRDALAEITGELAKLSGLLNEVMELKILVKEKDKIIADLEDRVSDLEQYTRRDQSINQSIFISDYKVHIDKHDTTGVQNIK